MEITANILVAAAFGGVCAAIANSRGRSAVGWFFIGFFLSCIGIILVLVLPDLHEDEARRARLRLENRRLREQLRKERHVGDRRYADVSRRLEVHDQALAIDTSPPDGAPPELLAGTGSAAAAATDGERWWWVERGERQGPVPFDELKRLWVDGALDVDTLVWRAGMTDWQELAAVRGLADRLDA